VLFPLSTPISITPKEELSPKRNPFSDILPGCVAVTCQAFFYPKSRLFKQKLPKISIT
jgi:hypothetical protein